MALRFVCRLVLLVACASAGACSDQLLFQSPDRVGSEWTETTSEHFLLRTDLDASTASRIALDMENMLSALAALAFTAESLPRSRVEVVNFRQRDNYKQVADKMTAGEFSWGGRHDFESTALAFLYGDFDKSTRISFQHELVHVLVHEYFPQAPSWLNEGLAEYYSTIEIDDDVAVVGRPSPNKSGYALRDLTALMNMTPEEFYGDANADPASDRGKAAAFDRHQHYAGAENLVRVLHEPTYRSPFFSYLRRLSTGEAEVSAWEKAFADVPKSRLEEDYLAEIGKKRVAIERTEYPPRTQLPVTTRRLWDVEVHAMWARLQKWSTLIGHRTAARELEEAKRVDFGSEELALVQAYWLYAHDASDAAVRTLTAALQTSPKSRRLLNALGWVKLDILVEQPGLSNHDIAQAVAFIETQLKPIAETAAEHDLVARYYAFRGDLDASLAHEKQAMAVDPSCVDCLVAASELIARQGNLEAAIQVATSAINLFPEGRGAEAARRQIARYRHEIARKTRVDAPALPRKPNE